MARARCLVIMRLKKVQIYADFDIKNSLIFFGKILMKIMANKNERLLALIA